MDLEKKQAFHRREGRIELLEVDNRRRRQGGEPPEILGAEIEPRSFFSGSKEGEPVGAADERTLRVQETFPVRKEGARSLGGCPLRPPPDFFGGAVREIPQGSGEGGPLDPEKGEMPAAAVAPAAARQMLPEICLYPPAQGIDAPAQLQVIPKRVHEVRRFGGQWSVRDGG